MILINLLVIFNTKLVFGNLVSEKTFQQSIGINEKKDFFSSENNFQDIGKVGTKGDELRLLRACEIKNCEECKNNTCIACSKHYLKEGNYCFSNHSMNKYTLFAIIFGTITFIFLFCFMY